MGQVFCPLLYADILGGGGEIDVSIFYFGNYCIGRKQKITMAM
jgi:hypothetical protein